MDRDEEQGPVYLQSYSEQCKSVANSRKFTQVTNGVINGLAGIASVATVVLDLLIGGAALVVDNWSWLAPIVGGVATAFLVLNGAMLAYKTVTGIVNALETVKAARLAMTTVATREHRPPPPLPKQRPNTA